MSANPGGCARQVDAARDRIGHGGWRPCTDLIRVRAGLKALACVGVLSSVAAGARRLDSVIEACRLGLAVDTKTGGMCEPGNAVT